MLRRDLDVAAPPNRLGHNRGSLAFLGTNESNNHAAIIVEDIDANLIGRFVGAAMHVFIGDAACCLAAHISNLSLPVSERIEEIRTEGTRLYFHGYCEKARVACVEI